MSPEKRVGGAYSLLGSGLGANTIPISGFKTVKQVEENAAAMHFGPLSVAEIE
jgi:aryl-alcohol dehydrogenase-like predicted oxidoreductase